MTKLYPFQKRGVRQIIRFGGRVLLADEMGLGKTIQALSYLRQQTGTIPALVVCPASAKWVWKNEIKKHTHFKSQILNGKSPRPIQCKDITIINYDILPQWKDVLKGMNHPTMILDECQCIKSWQAKRTKAVISLGRNKPHILALSGTPLTNRPKELYNVLHLLLPERFTSFVPYAWRFCNRRITPWGWDDNGASHLDELHNILKETCMIRRCKKQVLSELPDKQRSVILLPVNLTEYRRAEDDFINWLAEQDVAKAEKAKQAEALVQLGYLKRLAAKLKMKAVMEWMDDYFESTDAKLVVFAYHKSIIQTLHQQYKKFSVVLDGRTSQAGRIQSIQKFQEDKQTRLFIGQLIAAGTAITLTAASTAAFVELDWVPSNHIQAEDRLHRIGQKAHTQIYYIVSKDTIEEDLCNIIQKKAKTITSVLDGRKRKDELNIFDKLKNIIYERKNNG